MNTGPIHGADRYAICNAAGGASRLVETATTEHWAVMRANTLSRQLGKPFEVKDRADPDERGKSRVIYRTAAIQVAGGPLQHVRR